MFFCKLIPACKQLLYTSVTSGGDFQQREVKQEQKMWEMTGSCRGEEYVPT